MIYENKTEGCDKRATGSTLNWMAKEDLVERVTCKVNFEWLEGTIIWKKSCQAEEEFEERPQGGNVCRARRKQEW